MAKREFSAAVDVEATPEEAFDWVAEFRHVSDVLEGVTKWEPLGSKTRGVGALYNVEMTALGLPLSNVLRLDRWRRPHEIGWVSESGLIKQEGEFRFTEVNKGARIELRIAYEPPAAVVGMFVAQRVDGMVRRRLENALRRIKEALETKP
jgi:ribosome-associated toxin RatA of RatAB toxin-antitoxin module